jgi:hypothetical protein
MATDAQRDAPEPVPAEDAGTDEACVCHACLFCENTEQAVRAIPVLEKAVANFRGTRNPQLEIWPAEAFGHSVLVERMRQCAHHADVVAFAVDGNDGLGEPLQQWLELWEQHCSGMPTRLLALLHPRSPDHLPMIPAFRELTAFAIRTGVGLIWCGFPAERPQAGRTPGQVAAAVAS